jgi:hypothetical protein
MVPQTTVLRSLLWCKQVVTRWAASLPTKVEASAPTVAVRVLATHRRVPSAWAQVPRLLDMPRHHRLDTHPDHLVQLLAVPAMVWAHPQVQHTTQHRLLTRPPLLHTARDLPHLHRTLPHPPAIRQPRPATRLRRRATLPPRLRTALLLLLTEDRAYLLPLHATAPLRRHTRPLHRHTARQVLRTTLVVHRTRLHRPATARHRRCTAPPVRHSKATLPRLHSILPTLLVKPRPSTHLLAPSTHPSKSRTFSYPINMC